MHLMVPEKQLVSLAVLWKSLAMSCVFGGFFGPIILCPRDEAEAPFDGRLHEPQERKTDCRLQEPQELLDSMAPGLQKAKPELLSGRSAVMGTRLLQRTQHPTGTQQDTALMTFLKQSLKGTKQDLPAKPRWEDRILFTVGTACNHINNPT